MGLVGFRHKQGEPDLLIRLPDGSEALIAVDLTDYQASAEQKGSTKPSALLDWAGLRQMADLIAHFQQQRTPSDEDQPIG